MVVMCPRAQSPATAGLTIPVTSEASTQRELQKEDAALQVWGCRECLWPLAKSGAAGVSFLGHRRCAVIKDLCHQVKELQEEVSSLHSIRDNEKEIDQIFSNTAASRAQTADCTEGRRVRQSLCLSVREVETPMMMRVGR